jgi:signal peptidase I
VNEPIRPVIARIRPSRRRAGVGALVEVLLVLAMALALSLLIKTFLVQAFSIPSGSMEDTLLVGDRVLVSKLTPGPFSLQHGDVIVFKDPGGWLSQGEADDPGAARGALASALSFVGLLPQDAGQHLIKRVIGLPGDTVTCCDAQGRLMVNGVPIDETYVRVGNVPSQDRFSVTVLKDHLWVMGDNRGDSCDSRYHPTRDGGQVPVSNVVGKAFSVVWPLSRFGGVVEPPGVFRAVPATPGSGPAPAQLLLTPEQTSRCG